MQSSSPLSGWEKPLINSCSCCSRCVSDAQTWNVHSSDDFAAVSQLKTRQLNISSGEGNNIFCLNYRICSFDNLAAAFRMGSPDKQQEKTQESINTKTSHKSHCFSGLPTVVCIVLSVCSMAFCLLVNFKTSHLEHRVHVLEMEKMMLFHSDGSTREENGTGAGLQDMIEKLVQEVRLLLSERCLTDQWCMKVNMCSVWITGTCMSQNNLKGHVAIAITTTIIIIIILTIIIIYTKVIFNPIH